MSEKINLMAIGLCSTMTGVQIGTAIYDWWKEWRKSRRRQLTGFEKVKNGDATVNGWKLAISDTNLTKQYVMPFVPKIGTYDFIYSSWPIEDNDSTRTDFYTLPLGFEHKTPNGRKVYYLCKNSLISPDHSLTLMKIIYDGNQWAFDTNHYLSDRIIVSIFRLEPGHRQYRLVFTSVLSKFTRFITIEAPADDSYIDMIHQSECGKRINVVFNKYFWDIDGPPILKFEFYDVTYEILSTSGNIEIPIRSSIWESISCPVGNRRQTYRFNLYPINVILFDPDHPENINDHRVISSDSPGNWRIDNYPNWVKLFRSTIDGTKLMNAIESIGSLSPPKWSNVTPLKRLNVIRHSDTLFYGTNESGIFRRHLSPPTLKSLAAETFCQAYPKMNMSNLKKAIGFDIFDGIFDQGKDEQVIYF